MSIRMMSTLALVFSLLFTAGCSTPPQVKNTNKPHWSTCMVKAGAVMGIPAAAYSAATGGAAFVAGGLIGGTACAALDPVADNEMMMVNFDFNHASLKSAEVSMLKPILDNFNKQDSIEIVGHTCDIGTTEYNQRLSERRAESVKEYLVSKGIPADKIKVSGKGETQPVRGNETEAMQQENRRAEISLIKQH